MTSGHWWLVLQSDDSKYEDESGSAYEFPAHIPNGRRIDDGDVLVVLAPKDVDPELRILGAGVIGTVDPSSTEGRRVARFDAYHEFKPRLSFDDIGGDPRNNKRNSINPIEAGYRASVLSRIPEDMRRQFAVSPIPGPTEFEQKLSDIIDPIVEESKGGYRFGAADTLVEPILGLEKYRGGKYTTGGVRFKQAGGSSRGANVIKEGAHLQPDLYVVIRKGDTYSMQSLRDKCITDMSVAPELYDTVAFAEQVEGIWRVVSAIGLRPFSAAKKAVEEKFPLVGEVEILGESIPDPVERLPPEAKTLVEMRDRFGELVASADLTVDLSLQCDVLAACLSSQFILFAGPSGTGKSTLARLLAEFFTPTDHFAVIEAQRQWIGPADVAGYYSPLAGRYVETSSTAALIRLNAASSDAYEGNMLPPTPILLFEEANLSPIEGYGAPLVHGLSAPSTESVTWPLYTSGSIDSGDDGEKQRTAVPASIDLWPWPRIFGTINVDQTAAAPARKIAGRAAVVLLETVQGGEAEAWVEAISALGATARPSEEHGAGAAYLQDPKAILASLTEDDLADLSGALEEFLDKISPRRAVDVSQRDAVRCILFMAYHTRLLEDLETDKTRRFRLAAESGFMHFLLPNISAELFEPVLEHLTPEVLLSTSPDGHSIGGILLPRAERIRSVVEAYGGLSGTVDFWSALS